MKDKLNKIGMKITELANHLNLSRPTVYKMIEMYETGQTKDLKKQHFDLFEFIDKENFLTKTSVIRYILKMSNSNEIVIDTKAYSKDRIKLIKKILSLPDDSNTNSWLLQCLKEWEDKEIK